MQFRLLDHLPASVTVPEAAPVAVVTEIARFLQKNPDRLTQHCVAKTRGGRVSNPTANDAACFCSVGILCRYQWEIINKFPAATGVKIGEISPYLEELYKVTGGLGVLYLNDAAPSPLAAFDRIWKPLLDQAES